MNARTTIIIVLLGFVIGNLSGAWFSLSFICADQNKAIVKQLEVDDKKVTEIKKKAEVRYVTVEKIKTVIKEIPDTTGCIDTPSPELESIVFDALNAER